MMTPALLASTLVPKQAPEGVACNHCGLPVPNELVEAEAEKQFCCAGCRTAYQIIHDAGLERYYAMRDAVSAEARPAQGRGERYAAMNDPAYEARHVRTADDGRKSTTLFLAGIHCAACIWLLERVPSWTPGVLSVRVNLAKSTAVVEWRGEQVVLATIAQAFDRLGYPPSPVPADGGDAARRAEERTHLVRLAVAGACAGNAMLLAIALYAGAFTGMAVSHAQLFRYVSALLAAVAIAWPGRVFFRGALTAIRTRTPHIDLPLALGLGVGGIAGLVETAAGTADVYFDSLTVLVFLLLVGRYVKFRQQRQAADSIGLLDALTPRVARKVDGAEIREVPIEGLLIGDLVEVRPGEVVPADGVVVSGCSQLDRSILTGETEGVPVEVGDEAPAGAVNLLSPLRLRVAAVGGESRVGRLMKLVEEATQSRTPLVQFADRVGGRLVVLVLCLSALTMLLWWWTNPAGAVRHTVALLVVACPCALGLATPLALAVALGRAARKGILIKEGEVLERLAKPGRIWLDKTGTLTVGRTTLVQWHGDESSRPLAKAIVDACPDAPAAEEVIAKTGRGVAGVVAGSTVVVGSPAWLGENNVRPGDVALQAAVESVLAAGLTPVHIAVDGRWTAVAGLGDAIRSDAADAIAKLKRQGWKVGVLSGDHPTVVERVAAAVGIDAVDALGGATPEEKLSIVQKSEDETVVMVGDGVNDAAALAAATVGVAVHGGAEVSLQAAPVYLAKPGLGLLLDLVCSGNSVVRTIHRNFGASLAYNFVAMGLAVGGMMNPLLAAVLMPASSITVVALSIAGGRRR